VRILLDLPSKLRRRKRDAREGLDRYWERRARDLIGTYDRPETWPERRWLRAGAEEETVPCLLDAAGVRSVLVPGCGSGRQFGFLEPYGFDLGGFDISPTMVKTCRKRFPRIDTRVAEVVGCDKIFEPFDAVFSSAVLAHVPPHDIEAAVGSIVRLARKMIVLREKTRFDEPSDYQWAHPYDELLSDWRLVHREATDEGDTFKAELMAWARPDYKP